MQKDSSVLHLTLKKKWFDMILSGEKKEEYREYKHYWLTRFELSIYDKILFKNGYSANARWFIIELTGIDLAESKHPEWGGDPYGKQFILKLGKILPK